MKTEKEHHHVYVLMDSMNKIQFVTNVLITVLLVHLQHTVVHVQETESMPQIVLVLTISMMMEFLKIVNHVQQNVLLVLPKKHVLVVLLEEKILHIVNVIMELMKMKLVNVNLVVIDVLLVPTKMYVPYVPELTE